jgi:hypothetical protein
MTNALTRQLMRSKISHLLNLNDLFANANLPASQLVIRTFEDEKEEATAFTNTINAVPFGTNLKAVSLA